MKILSYILFILAFGFIFVGIYYDLFVADRLLQDKFYGIGSLILFFLAMPVFLISRRNSKSWEKYKWNQEKFEKNKKSKNF